MSLPYRIEENQNQVNLQTMADIVYHALMHLGLVSDHTPIDEGFAKYPIVEYLERQLHCPKIALEHSFGDIFPTDRRMDLYFEDSEEKKYAIEFKYISERSEGSAELQRIFNDTVRMSLTLSDLGFTRAFVLLFGKTEHFLPLLSGMATNSQEKMQETQKQNDRKLDNPKLSWLDSSFDKEISVWDKDISDKMNQFGQSYFYNKKTKKYIDPKNIRARIKKRKLSYKTVLRTRTIKSSKDNDTYKTNSPFMVAIWEIVND